MTASVPCTHISSRGHPGQRCGVGVPYPASSSGWSLTPVRCDLPAEHLSRPLRPRSAGPSSLTHTPLPFHGIKRGFVLWVQLCPPKSRRGSPNLEMRSEQVLLVT